MIGRLDAIPEWGREGRDPSRSPVPFVKSKPQTRREKMSFFNASLYELKKLSNKVGSNPSNPSKPAF